MFGDVGQLIPVKKVQLSISILLMKITWHPERALLPQEYLNNQITFSKCAFCVRYCCPLFPKQGKDVPTLGKLRGTIVRKSLLGRKIILSHKFWHEYCYIRLEVVFSIEYWLVKKEEPAWHASGFFLFIGYN